MAVKVPANPRARPPDPGGIIAQNTGDGANASVGKTATGLGAEDRDREEDREEDREDDREDEDDEDELEP